MSAKKIKVCLLLASAMMLAGCTSRKNTDLQSDLNERLAAVNQMRSVSPVYSHKYFSFYIQPSIGRISSDETSDIFNRCGTKFFMNLNVPAIINAEYYDDADSELLDVNAIEAAHASGTYTDYAGNEHQYGVEIYTLRGFYLILAESDTVSFGSVCYEADAAGMAAEMIRIARTVDVDRDAVLRAFSNRQDISYHRQRLELFHNIAPENGAVNELFDNTGTSESSSQGEFIGDNFADPGAVSPESAAPSASVESEN